MKIKIIISLILIFMLISCILKIEDQDENNSIGSKYYVYGGNSQLSGTLGYNPENNGFTLLGTGNNTDTYNGSYDFYCITVYPVNIINLDALQGSNNQFYNNGATGNTTDWQNITNNVNEPDTNTGKIGGLYDGDKGGYICIDASGDNLTSITVHISN